MSTVRAPRRSICRRPPAIVLTTALILWPWFPARIAHAGASVHYVDVAEQMGLTRANRYGDPGTSTYILETTGNGVALFDADNDGDLDILLPNGSSFAEPDAAPPPVFYLNDGDGNFAAAPDAGFRAKGWLQGVCAGDYDNDGDTDILLTRFGSNLLYANDGSAQFTDVTQRSGLHQSDRWGAGCSFVDYDRDGLLDLAISNYVDLDLTKTPKPGESANCKWRGLDVMCGPRGLPRAKAVLFHNDGDGKFSDATKSAGFDAPPGFGLGVVAGDFDDDGWPDIYIACDMTPSLLFRNNHDGTFTEVGAETGVAYNADGALQAGMGVAVADYDGDGLLDIAKTNFSGDLPSLFHNDGDWFFTDLAQPAGLGSQQLLGWGAAWIDADEDTWPDLFIVNGHVYPEVDAGDTGERYRQPALLFHNQGSGQFTDATAQSGSALVTPRAARGLALGDLDADGRPELVIVDLNRRPAVLKNTAPGRNHVTIRLQGTDSNRSAIGAKVTLKTAQRTQTQEVRSGDSYLSQHALELYFGLAQAETIDELTVRWPNGETQTWQDLPTNQTHTLTESQ